MAGLVLLVARLHTLPAAIKCIASAWTAVPVGGLLGGFARPHVKRQERFAKKPQENRRGNE